MKIKIAFNEGNFLILDGVKSCVTEAEEKVEMPAFIKRKIDEGKVEVKDESGQV